MKNILHKRVLLFDMDGVLVDVSESYRKAVIETVKYFTNVHVTAGEIQTLKEKGDYNNDWDLSEALIIHYGMNIEKRKIITKFNSLYLGMDRTKGFIDNENWILSGDTLKRICRGNILGIVTGKPRAEAEYVLAKNSAAEYFDVVITMEDCPEGRGKPDPYGINLALERLGKRKAIYFGDSIDDMKAARCAGIQVMGVLPPDSKSDKLPALLRENGTKTILHDINDIEGVLV
jgi:HAD superfamily phosphatase